MIAPIAFSTLNRAMLDAAAREVEDKVIMINNTGLLYGPEEERPAQRYSVIFSNEDSEQIRGFLNQIGLKNFAELLRFEYYKETREKALTLYAPIKSNVISIRLWQLRNAHLLQVDSVAKAYFEYILEHVNLNAVDELFYHMPTIVVTDLAQAGVERRFVQILRDMNPTKVREYLGAELQQARNSSWEKAYNEIVDPNLRDAVKVSLEARMIAMPNEPAETFDQAVKYIRHGAAHEISHFVAGYLTEVQENILAKSFLAARDINHPLYRLFAKNMARALLAAEPYRQKNKIPEPTVKSSQMSLFMFVNEMFCDTMAMYIYELAGQQHIYSEYGIALSAEVRAVYESFMNDLKQWDADKTLLLFSETQILNSKMTQAQRFMGG